MATTGKRPARLKNYASEASETSIFSAIRAVLVAHKAKRITFEQDDEGRSTSIEFQLDIVGPGTGATKKSYTFRLPARFAAVEALVAESYRVLGKNITGERLRDQAYRTAWANIRDWIAAQMALVDSGMVKTEEVFLPYLLIDDGNGKERTRTMFEVFFDEQQQQRALPSPHRRGGGDFTVTEVL